MNRVPVNLGHLALTEKPLAVREQIAQNFHGLPGQHLPSTGLGHPRVDHHALALACDDHDNGALVGLHARVQVLAHNHAIDRRAHGGAFKRLAGRFAVVFCLVQCGLGLAHCGFHMLNFRSQGAAPHQVEIFVCHLEVCRREVVIGLRALVVLLAENALPLVQGLGAFELLLPRREADARLLHARFRDPEFFRRGLFAQQGELCARGFEVGDFPFDFLFGGCRRGFQIPIVQLGDGLAHGHRVPGFDKDFVQHAAHGRVDIDLVPGFDNALGHDDIVDLDQRECEREGSDHPEDPQQPFVNSVFPAAAHHGIFSVLFLDRSCENIYIRTSDKQMGA